MCIGSKSGCWPLICLFCNCCAGTARTASRVPKEALWDIAMSWARVTKKILRNQKDNTQLCVQIEVSPQASAGALPWGTSAAGVICPSCIDQVVANVMRKGLTVNTLMASKSDLTLEVMHFRDVHAVRGPEI
eukprot:1155388-Pelagomonas_calceolata.AAC.2